MHGTDRIRICQNAFRKLHDQRDIICPGEVLIPDRIGYNMRVTIDLSHNSTLLYHPVSGLGKKKGNYWEETE